MRRFLLFTLVAASFPRLLFAVSMNFTGTARTEATYYNKLGLGDPSKNSTKAFIGGRFLLDPNLVVDDHFSVKSEWSLINSPTFTPSGVLGNSVGQGGYIYGDNNTAALALNRAWLEWTSDFGVFRAGRQPFSWGYGLIWDAGDNVWDDFQTTLDRLEYRLHLGHVIGALAYSKPRKGSVLGDENDQNFYSIYLQYDNPEMDVEAGIVYEKQVRSSTHGADYLKATPYAVPTDPNPTSQTPSFANTLATAAPSPLSNNVVDVYLKKTFGYFTFGGEVGWLSGNAVDLSGNTNATLNGLGLTLNGSYEYHKVKAFLDFLYAAGDANAGSGHVNAFVTLNRNRRPGLILGRELLGPYAGNQVGFGSPVFYGNPGSFSGVFYFRPGLRFDWASSWTSGVEVIIAQKAAVQPGEARALGVEVDLGTDYIVYKNFELGINLGYLFPGNGLVSAVPSAPSPQGPFAVRTTASLKF